jgi:hypothetical protein
MGGLALGDVKVARPGTLTDVEADVFPVDCLHVVRSRPALESVTVDV